MSLRCPDLPFLPGFTFNPNVSVNLYIFKGFSANVLENAKNEVNLRITYM